MILAGTSVPSKILWTAAEADVITGGISTSPWVASGVCLKLEDVRPGDLFFAGPEDCLDHARLRGAAAAVLSRRGPDRKNSPLPLLQVDDVFEAMRALALAARFRTHGIVMAVQGGARQTIFRALAAVSDVYEGGRHLSLGLAGMPEHCSYGVFGFSPSVRPDIAIIADGAAAMNSTVIESLPDNGIVLIYADDPEFAEVYARARSCGTRSIFTFGAAEHADARLLSRLDAVNGINLRLRVLGADLDLSLPAAADFDPAGLAALLVLKLMDMPLHRYAQIVAAACARADMRSGIATTNVSLVSAAMPSESAFRIKSVIDLGGRGRTALLENVRGAGGERTLNVARSDFQIPQALGNMNLVYACRNVSVFSDAQSQIGARHQQLKPEPIVTDVLAPGDFVVFRQIWQSSKTIFSQALRLTPNTG